MDINTEERNADDLRLVKLAKSGNLEAQEALIMRYAWIARSKARNYFIEGGTRDDLAQEGLFGIWKAIRDFDNEKNDNFISYVNMCVSSQIKDALRSHTRIKHKTLNEAVSLTYADVNLKPEFISDPVNNYIEREGSENFYNKLETICSPQQMTVLKYYFEGYTYNEIAKLTDLPQKKVDNILLAVKNKIKKNKEMFLDEKRYN